MSEREHRRAVYRAWAIMNGLDPDQLEADIAKRADEIKREMERDLEHSAKAKRPQTGAPRRAT